MKKILLLAIAVIVSVSASAQIKVCNIECQADTLLYLTQKGHLDGDPIEVYKNPKGYLIKIASSNMFDITPRLYLGETKEDAIQALNQMIELCNNDVATTIVIEDADGKLFTAITTYGTVYTKRTPTYTKSDRLHLTNDDIVGIITIKDKVAEEVIKFLKK